MKLPRITIVTPNLNGARYLEQTIQSVLQQNYPDLEHIVIDGGSSDGSLEIIERYADRLAFWCSEPDNGPAAAINRGLRMATGDVVNWLNSDDILLPGALQAIGETFARDSETDAICGWNVAFDKRGIIRQRIFPQPPAEVLLSRRLLPQDAVYWRMDVTRRIGLLSESYKVRFDMDYWCRMVREGMTPVLLPRFLSGFRIVPGQISATYTSEADSELADIVGKYGKRLSRRGSPRFRLWRLHRRFMLLLQKLRVPGMHCPIEIHGYLANLVGNQTACS